MKLEFDSVEDLDNFLNWAVNYGSFALSTGVSSIRKRSQRGADGRLVAGVGDVAFDTPPEGGSVGGHSVFTAGDGSPADQEAREVRVGPYDEDAPRMPPPVTGDPSGAVLQPAGDAQATEPAKRKRRTKAEIEAADAATALLKAQENGQIVAEGGQNAGEAALESARATLRDKAQTPADANPFDVATHAHSEVVTETATTNDAGTAEALPDAVVDTAITPFQHLTRAREFIAKHGMPKYNESFTKAELDANVMGYTAEQRALHMEALTALDQA